MTIDPELRQMLRDAKMARAKQSALVRLWHVTAEWLDIVTAQLPTGTPKPRGPIMLFDDARHAAKRITSKPGTAVACIVMLALAIGVTSAMFTVADHMLLRPAPFKDAGRIKQLWIGAELKKSQLYLKPDLAKSFRQCAAFEAVSFFVQAGVVIEGTNGVINKGAGWISVNTFDLLGVKPLMGRTFVAGEGRPGTDDVMVISERVWRTEFGSDPAIIGREIAISGAPVKVIGVMPESVRFPYESTTIWRPYDIDSPPAAIAANSVTVFARLARGASESDASRVAAEVSKPFSKTPDRHGVILRSIGAGFLDDYSRTAIRVLLSGVGLVFLVLCANAANLILSRTNARRHEFGVCASLGATRTRLMRQVFLENAMIGAAALVAGLAMTWGLVALARGFLPEAFLLKTLNPLQLDARVFGVAAVLALGATMISGVPPAWIGTRLNAADALRVETRGGSESKSARAWTRALLIGEVALASALLVGAGVLTASFVKLVALDPGVHVKNVTTMWVTLPEFYFKDRPARAALAVSLQNQIRALPGVNAVTLSLGLPPNGGGFGWGHLVADGVPLPGTDEQTLFNSYVTPEFFDVYGVKLLQGRTFEASDSASAAIVSERLAAMLWPGQSALGHTFQFTDSQGSNTVIGVAHEIRSSLDDPREDLPEYYMKFNGPGSANVMLGMRCDGPCPNEQTIRQRAHDTDARAIVVHVDTLESKYLLQFAQPRAAAGLAASFAIISVMAAAGGLFSILTYAVNRRRREFGVRSAMGARPDQLRALILKDGLMISAVGLAIGGVLTFALNKTLQSLSFGITAANPAVWLSVALVVCAVTILAAWRPAANAMRSDPIALLRDN